MTTKRIGIVAIILILVVVGFMAAGVPFSILGHNGGSIVASSASTAMFTFAVSDSSFGSINNGLHWREPRQFHMLIDERSLQPIISNTCSFWGGTDTSTQSNPERCSFATVDPSAFG